MMAIFVCFLQGAFELLGLTGFLVGYFMDIGWLMILGLSCAESACVTDLKGPTF